LILCSHIQSTIQISGNYKHASARKELLIELLFVEMLRATVALLGVSIVMKTPVDVLLMLLLRGMLVGVSLMVMPRVKLMDVPLGFGAQVVGELVNVQLTVAPKDILTIVLIRREPLVRAINRAGVG
jgi:hypothetical protein